MSAELQNRWQATWPELEAAARLHVDRIDPEPFWPLAPGVARARVGDGHDAARLLSAHLDALPFKAERAILVPGHTVVVADAAHSDALRSFLAEWEETQEPSAQAWPLQRSADGWVAWKP